MSDEVTETVETPVDEAVEASAVEEMPAPEAPAASETSPEAPAVEEPAQVAVEPAMEAEEPKKRGRKPSSAVEVPSFPARALTSGAADDAIAAAQRKMGVAETGVLDTATKDAVKAVQKKARIKADGVITPATWAKIFS